MSAELSVRAVHKRFGDVTALDGVDLEIAAGSLVALVGPSGCGKSTLLSVIAGLLDFDGGTVRLGGSDLSLLPAERRPVALVFQKPLLFPHLDVAANVGFGLRMRGVAKSEIRRRATELLDLVQLGGLGSRRVGELSGGQEQRVALARALALQPDLLLLDEPFSQLDAELRAEMRALVRRLHDEQHLTTLFVTHDQAEAVEIADDIALMLDGTLAGQGPPELFFRRPPTLAAARFFRATNELDGTITDGVFRAGDLTAPTTVADGPAVLVVRPEAVRIDAADGVPARVMGARFAGTHLVVDLVLTGEVTLVAHVPIGTPVQPGSPTTIVLPTDACTIFAGRGR